MAAVLSRIMDACSLKHLHLYNWKISQCSIIDSNFMVYPQYLTQMSIQQYSMIMREDWSSDVTVKWLVACIDKKVRVRAFPNWHFKATHIFSWSTRTSASTTCRVSFTIVNIRHMQTDIDEFCEVSLADQLHVKPSWCSLCLRDQ